MLIPGVASTSIGYALKKHTNVEEYSRKPDDVFVLGVTRHPYDRLVSVYQYFCRSADGGRLHNAEMLTKAGLFWNMPWETFLANMRHHSYMSMHTAEQGWWWKDITPDYMVAIEDLGSSWKKLQEFCLELSDLPKEHLNKVEHGPWEEHFNHEQTVRFAPQLQGDLEVYSTAKESKTTLAKAYKAWRLKNLR